MKKEIIFSECYKAGKRTYFFDIKETIDQKRYLSITESKKVNDQFEKFKLLIFDENIKQFAEHFNSSVARFYENITTDKEISHMEKQKLKYENAYKPWTQEDDEHLEMFYCEGHTNVELANHFGRNVGSISSRIKKLNIDDKYPDIR